jgi:hypothetical protein
MLCKIWGFHGSGYEECRLLGYKNPVRTSQETYYVNVTGPSQLMLCKIWGFHGGDCEECRLQGYKYPGRTSEETNYVSVTGPSRLMLCKIWGFHCCDYEECRLLGYKHPVGTSQETHYVSATEHSRLMLCKIWGFSRLWLRRMSSSGMLRRVALVRNVSELRFVSIIRVKWISERWTVLSVISTRATRCHIPEDGILYFIRACKIEKNIILW